MPPLVLLRDNRRLSDVELRRAQAICREALGWLGEREAYIEQHAVDRRFALPDANWSYEAPNEFARLFQRVVQADERTLAHFRGLSQVFSGYSLYQVCNGYGFSAATMELPTTLDSEIAVRLAKQNQAHIEDWRQMTVGLPRRYWFMPPALLGEVGHDVDGVIVNSDTCTYQERVNLIYASGLADLLDEKVAKSGKVRIAEIGGGYGALCHWFMQAYPGASYTIIDLPESLLFARLYVSLTRPDLVTTVGLEQAHQGVRFVPNYMAEQLDETFDLVINTLSMSEMSEYQIRRYADLIKQAWLRDGGVFFEQNQDNRRAGLPCAERVLKREFPFRIKTRPSRHRPRNGRANIWALSQISLKRKPFGSVRPSRTTSATPLISRIVAKLRAALG